MVLRSIYIVVRAKVLAVVFAFLRYIHEERKERKCRGKSACGAARENGKMRRQGDDEVYACLLLASGIAKYCNRPSKLGSVGYIQGWGRMAVYRVGCAELADPVLLAAR